MSRPCAWRASAMQDPLNRVLLPSLRASGPLVRFNRAGSGRTSTRRAQAASRRATFLSTAQCPPSSPHAVAASPSNTHSLREEWHRSHGCLLPRNVTGETERRELVPHAAGGDGDTVDCGVSGVIWVARAAMHIGPMALIILTHIGNRYPRRPGGARPRLGSPSTMRPKSGSVSAVGGKSAAAIRAAHLHAIHGTPSHAPVHGNAAALPKTHGEGGGPGRPQRAAEGGARCRSEHFGVRRCRVLSVILCVLSGAMLQRRPCCWNRNNSLEDGFLHSRRDQLSSSRRMSVDGSRDKPHKCWMQV